MWSLDGTLETPDGAAIHQAPCNGCSRAADEHELVRDSDTLAPRQLLEACSQVATDLHAVTIIPRRPAA